MERRDDLEILTDLPRLLGIDLYTELFHDQSVWQSDTQKLYKTNNTRYPRNLHQLSPDSNIDYAHDQVACQPGYMDSQDVLEDYHGLSLLHTSLGIGIGLELCPNDHQSFYTIPRPLDTDDHIGSVFNCDCGEAFNSLTSMIAHRETVPQHKPWHAVWEAQGDFVCLCGRPFNDEPAVRRHIKLANARTRRRGWEQRRVKFHVCPGQQKSRHCCANESQELEEAAKLQQHVKEIDMLIVDATMRQLAKAKDEMPTRKISQKQRKRLEREKAKKLLSG